jgi:hypothetical protein
VGQTAVAAVPLSPLQGTQALDVASQTGAAAGQLLLELQPHLLPVAPQTGNVPPQAVEFVDEHCTHCPPRHTGAMLDGHAKAAADPKSPLHATQVVVAVSQTGAGVGHSALLAQPHLPEATMQMGVVPAHKLVLPLEHCAHAPEPWQAGLVLDGQARVAPEPLSPLHPAQVPAAASQSGVFPTHWVELVAEH